MNLKNKINYFLLIIFWVSLISIAQESRIDEIRETLWRLREKQLSRPTDSQLAKDWDLFQLKMKKIRFLTRFYKSTPSLLKIVEDELKQVNKLLIALEEKKTIKPVAGTSEEAYFDSTDGSVQPFITYIPANYDDKEKRSLIIYLHGYSPHMNIVNWSEMPDGLNTMADELNAVVAMPFGRSNTDFQGIGERDVLAVIEQMKKRYKINSNKIFLSGMSMGGMGVWTIASHYPHLFAGLIILSGRGDFYFWHKLDHKKILPHRKYLIDKEFASSHLPNLKQIPIWVFHGDADTLIPVSEARLMKSLLKVNSNLKYKEIPGGDHWIHEKVFSNWELKDWMKKAVRKTPESFEFISFHPAYNRAHWLYISEYEKNTRPATVKVKLKDDNIHISALGVKELVLDRNKMPKSIQKFKIIKGSDFDLRESRGDKNIRPHYPWGPVKDAFLKPFMFVNAGIDDKQMKARIIEWYKFSKSLPRFKTEKALTEKDRENFNLFLFGEPESSPMIKEVLKNTPIKISETEYIVGDKKYPRKGSGLFLKYSSPWNSSRSVVIQSGVPWGKNASGNHLYDFLPGYLIYSENSDQNDPFGSNEALCGGFFDNNGKL